MDGMIVSQQELSPAEVREYVLVKLQDQIARENPRMRAFDVRKVAQKCLNQALRNYRGKKIYRRIERHPANRFEALKEAYAPAWLRQRWPVKYITRESH
jgi:hypothetical protein